MDAMASVITDMAELGHAPITVGSKVTDMAELGRMSYNDQGNPYWDELGSVGIDGLGQYRTWKEWCQWMEKREASREERRRARRERRQARRVSGLGEAPIYASKLFTPAHLQQYNKLRLDFEKWRSESRLVPSPWRETLISENEEKIAWRLGRIAEDAESGRWSTVADYYAYNRVPQKLAVAWANLEDIRRAVGMTPPGTTDSKKIEIAEKVVDVSRERAEKSGLSMLTVGLIAGGVALSGLIGVLLSRGRRK